MKNRLGRLEQQLFALVQLRKLRTLRTGDLSGPLQITLISGWCLTCLNCLILRGAGRVKGFGARVLAIIHIKLEIGKGFEVEVVILENVTKVSRDPVVAALTCFALCVFDRRT